MHLKYKYIHVTIFTVIILSLSSFLLLWQSHATQKETNDISCPLINLVESTHIIRTLIVNNQLESLLEDHDPEQLTLLLNNVSPAKMAFESEVLSTTIPLVVVYYFQENEESKKFLQKLKKLAMTYDDIIKFVTVDVDQLFSLVQDAEIETLPTIVLVKNREIIEKIEDIISITQLEQLLKNHIIKKQNI